MVKIEEFKKQYIKAIQNGTAAVFAGAGLSRSSGFVDWKELLRDLADAVKLDINRESDLVEVAQYYCNERGGRAEINNRILNQFISDSKENESMNILSSLPIATYWTTNYDSLIENTLRRKSKLVDVKIAPNSLATSLDQRDAIVYKMHGDYMTPTDCVITKDDFETYNQKRQLFTTALQGDLVTKTFLFIGFSFEDPNLKYVLSRIRVLLNENTRTHYCFLKQINKGEYTDLGDYYYDCNKQTLRINDLKRYGIQAIMLDSYDEIPKILKEINKGYKTNSVFISGSAQEYDNIWKTTFTTFIKELVKLLYRKGFRIVTGHGRGVGSYVISSVIEECQENVSSLEKHLTIKAFPYEDREREDYNSLKTEYRKGIFRQAGIAIFMFGNKIVDGKVVSADGVLEEYQIAEDNDAFIIPIGSTGYAAKKIWEHVNQNIDNYPYLKSEIKILGNCTDPSRILHSIEQVLLNVQKLY